MIKYVFLYKDEVKNLSYYYNMEDQYVYFDNIKINNINSVAKQGGMYGGWLGIVLYPFIGNFAIHLSGSILVLMIIVLGFLAAGMIMPLIVKKSSSVFIEENRIYMTMEDMKRLYYQGTRFRRKYKVIEIVFFLFCFVTTLFLGVMGISIVMFLMLTIMWACLGIMVFAQRPICNFQFKKMFSL